VTKIPSIFCFEVETQNLKLHSHFAIVLECTGFLQFR
jgi:hypothetical protein